MGSHHHQTDFSRINVWRQYMKGETNTLAMVSGVIAILVIAVFLFWMFFSIPGEILLGLVVGLIPSGVIWHLQSKRDAKAHRDWLLTNKDAYLIEIVDTLISLIQNKDHSADKQSKILIKRIQDFQPALLCQGSPAVIRAWDELQENITNSRSDSDGGIKSTIRAGERFFRVIRKELGREDSALKPGEIWSSLLVKEDKHLALDACKNEKYN